MVPWMCHVSLRDRKSPEEIRNRLSIANITVVLRQIRLRCFGNVKKMDKVNPVNSYRFIEVEGQRRKGRPNKTWPQLINDDLRKLKLQSGLAKKSAGLDKSHQRNPIQPTLV